MFDFDRMPCIYWPKVVKASFLQRRIIVYSIMYYELNESCVTDKEYDSQSHQLLGLYAKMSEDEIERTDYSYCMKDFDASTGFDLYGRLKEKDKAMLMGYAIHILHQYKVGRKK